MKEFLYYPGCSMGGTAKGYAESLAAVAGPLGIDLREVDDWSCCGASEYFSIGLCVATRWWRATSPSPSARAATAAPWSHPAASAT